MEKKNAVRLSAMERNQIETNRRLDDLQSMMQNVLSTLTCNDDRRGKEPEQSLKPPSIDKSREDNVVFIEGESSRGAPGTTEKWWSEVCKSSDEEERRKDDRLKSSVNEIRRCEEVNKTK